MTTPAEPRPADATLDANALIALLDEEHVHHDAVIAILEQITGEVFMHPLNVAEVLTGYPEDQRYAIYDEVFGAERGGLGFRLGEDYGSVDEEITLLASYRATGVKMPDACVLTKATLTGSQVIVTFDRRLAAAARERPGTTVMGAPARGDEQV